jgi:hypothetical protein
VGAELDRPSIESGPSLSRFHCRPRDPRLSDARSDSCRSRALPGWLERQDWPLRAALRLTRVNVEGPVALTGWSRMLQRFVMRCRVRVSVLSTGS